jgi:hypothetical protein
VAGLALLASLLTFFSAVSGWGHESPYEIRPDPQYALPKDGEGIPKVSSVALIENAKFWDGRTVEFVGEAIGEGLRRGSTVWIHVNDDAYMWKNIEEGAVLGGYNSGQAVWLPAELAAKIRFFGDYKHEGDVLTVKGVFNAACREHGGDMDIHATELTILRAGHPVAHVVNTGRLLSGLILVAVAALVAALRRAARSRKI